MKIIVDAFGGDNAPLEIIKGSALALKEHSDLEIMLVGKEEKITEICKTIEDIDMTRISIVNAETVIEMSDHATEIMKTKSDCSMAEACRQLAQGNGDALVTAGSTGAIVVGATMIVKRLKGIKRAALAPIMPSNSGMFMLLDCGANSECKPEFLQQFAIMGDIYMRKVMGVKKPRVGLLNIGVEETKGTQLQLDTYSLLQKTPLNFIGNAEARDVPDGVCDVCVADGFTGNIFLKTYEGVAGVMMKNIKNIFTTNTKTKIAGSLVMKYMREFKKKMDYNEYGGAPLLGISKPVFKSHGSSNATTFKNAIDNTYKFVKNNVIGEIESALQNN